MVDAVVIGAGHNGLAAAAMLAQAGWRVGVYERSDQPGGAIKTREATLPGFRHDMGAMNLSLFAGSAFHGQFGAQLARYGLSFAPVQDCFASVFPDDRWLGVSTDLNITAARLAGASQADAATWRSLVAGFPTRAEQLFSILGNEATPRSLARRGWEIWRKGGVGAVRDAAQFLLTSPRAFLDSEFESERVKALLGAWGMHLDFPPDQAGGAVFPYLEGMANQAFGMVLGKGGADTMVKALVAMIERHGGHVECNAEVTEIRAASKGAKGIRLADGRDVQAKRAVIANVTPSALLRLLPKGTRDQGFDKRAKAFRHAPGTMMLHLAMDSLPDWAAGSELKRFAYVHIAPSLHHMSVAYADAAAGLLPRAPVLVVGQPTVVDPSRAPEGKHVLWVQVRMVPSTILGDASGEITARDWHSVKDAMAERVLDMMDGYAPGLRSKILGMAVVSPEELEADNPNLVGGDQLGGSHHPMQNFLFRPAPGWSDGRTPVDRLYLTGASCWPGAGVGAGSGTLLAKRLLRRR